MARESHGVGDTALALHTQRGTANGYLIPLLRLATSDFTVPTTGYRICLRNIGLKAQARLQDLRKLQARLAALTRGFPIALKDHITFLNGLSNARSSWLRGTSRPFPGMQQFDARPVWRPSSWRGIRRPPQFGERNGMKPPMRLLGSPLGQVPVVRYYCAGTWCGRV